MRTKPLKFKKITEKRESFIDKVPNRLCFNLFNNWTNPENKANCKNRGDNQKTKFQIFQNPENTHKN